MPFTIPESVRSYVRGVFADVNQRVAANICRMPTAYEESLDFALIGALAEHAVPVRVESDWLVRIGTYFLGGGRHFKHWEVADIGIIVEFRAGGKVKTKLAVFQSKRLYPDEQDYDEAEAEGTWIGMGELFDPRELLPAAKARSFNLSTQSRYKSLGINDEQQLTIRSYTSGPSVPVLYLFYNPLVLPWTVTIPVSTQITLPTECPVGCRVVPFDTFRTGMEDLPTRHHPLFAELTSKLPAPFNTPTNSGGWRLETFVVDRLLDCLDGHVWTGRRDEAADRLFNRRGGPISAALRITIDGPASATERPRD